MFGSAIWRDSYLKGISGWNYGTQTCAHHNLEHLWNGLLHLRAPEPSVTVLEGPLPCSLFLPGLPSVFVTAIKLTWADWREHLNQRWPVIGQLSKRLAGTLQVHEYSW